MTLYDELQGVAVELLTEFKQGSIVYLKITPGAGPADDPGPSVTSRFPVVGAAVRGAQFKYVTNGLAVASDLQATVPVDPAYTPEINGFLEVDGVPYKIVEIVKKPSAGTVVVYVLIIRKN